MKYKHLIFNNIDQSLGCVPFHFDSASIQRFAPQNVPFHVAIHHVSAIEPLDCKTVQLHQHNVDEINIFIPEQLGNFEYKIQLDNEIYTVNNHSTLFIPAGLSHAANFVRGSGYYICVILDSTQNLFPNM